MLHDWLIRDNENVAVIHCKAGKARTGMVVASFLIYNAFCSNPIAFCKCYFHNANTNRILGIENREIYK